MRVSLTLEGAIECPAGSAGLRATTLLLEGMAEQRSLRGAAERLGLSYRAAWGRLAGLEAALGQPVAVKTKGHGSRLTPFGKQVLDALRVTGERFAAVLAEEEEALTGRLAALTAPQFRPVRLAMSHDPLLVELAGAVPGIDLTVTGSTEAVRRLLDGQADAAGFHLGAEEPVADGSAPPIGDPAYEVIPLFRREQGLILASANPLAIADLRDGVRKGARFVNRQKGSGTRNWFDRLLGQHGISAGDVRGYEVEEFTHQAVAAVVASGMADFGMGARAAAERFGLAFLPIGEETYFLAMRAGAAPRPLDMLVERARAAAATPGYGPAPVESRAV